jgi:hypothetical protein
LFVPTKQGLKHELRNTPNCRVSAHLLVPGFTYTGMMTARMPEKPPAAWTPEEVVEFMLASLAKDDFYILCPDNDADEKRGRWATLSRTARRCRAGAPTGRNGSRPSWRGIELSRGGLAWRAFDVSATRVSRHQQVQSAAAPVAESLPEPEATMLSERKWTSLSIRARWMILWSGMSFSAPRAGKPPGPPAVRRATLPSGWVHELRCRRRIKLLGGRR